MMKSTFFRSVVVAAIVATAAGVAAMADDIKFEICYDRNGPGAIGHLLSRSECGGHGAI